MFDSDIIYRVHCVILVMLELVLSELSESLQ
jgi:hypothetical protein